MINVLDSAQRQRLARSVEHSFQELRRYTFMRQNTVQAYLGLAPKGNWDWTGMSNKRYLANLPKGNLLQQAGLSLQIALAYGEPKFLCTPRVPEHAGLALKLTEALNRMAKLLNLGETARNVAADSYFGYGIFKCGIGHLPLSARAATGLTIGPCAWRVSQKDLIYDITASNWDEVSYIGDIYHEPLNELQEIYPDAADRLARATDLDRLDSPHVLPRPSRFHSPEQEVWLMDVYFPGSQLVCTWPVRNESFGEIAEMPIAIREYEGHWSGVYQVLNHLYSPDEIIPIAQAESVKAIHFLFNDLMHATSEQARLARVNPMYTAAGDKDMQRLMNSKDRMPVPVTDPTRLKELFEVPGPSQSQTAYMAALMQFFEKFTNTLDEPQRAPTATQGQLLRDTTNATVAEARRKFNRVMQLVGYKLGHLLLNNNELILPASRPLRPGSNIRVDMTWLPPELEPRAAKIDDLDIEIEAYSTIYRSPEERLSLLFAINQQIGALMQLRALGAPISIEEAIETFAEYSGLPELRNWYEEIFPMQEAKRTQSGVSTPRLGVGQYVRHNVSEQTNDGALEQNLTQVLDKAGASPRVE